MGESILQALGDYLAGCPALGGQRMNIGYLPERAGPGGMVFSLDGLAGGAVGRQYLGSGAPSTRQLQFLIRGVGRYGPDPEGNLRGTAVFEQLALWMADQARRGALPTLPGGAQAIRLEVLEDGHRAENSAASGVYQMRCALTYLQY